MLGDVTLSLLAMSLEAATFLDARIALLEDGEVVCPSCGLVAESLGDPVVRVLACLARTEHAMMLTSRSAR
jgi:hypothetical protein